MCFFLREGGKNRIVMAVSDGNYMLEQLPAQIQKRFDRAGIPDPFRHELLEERKEVRG
jgi:pilus assembly protein CpaF